MSAIEVSQQEAVCAIQMNRPEKRNALTAPMYGELQRAFRRADEDPRTKVILISGNQSFTAGNDLQDFLANPPRDPDSEVFRFLDALLEVSKPIVAAVAGDAVGIGTTMLLHFDLVYAAENARFLLPFTRLGLCPEAASSYLLPLLMGRARAAELLLLAEPFGAAVAAQNGIVTRVVPLDQLLETAWDAARKLALLPARSVRATKLLMRAGGVNAVRHAMREEIETFAGLLDTPEAAEAFNAFLEKRKPDFTKFD